MFSVTTVRPRFSPEKGAAAITVYLPDIARVRRLLVKQGAFPDASLATEGELRSGSCSWSWGPADQTVAEAAPVVPEAAAVRRAARAAGLEGLIERVSTGSLLVRVRVRRCSQSRVEDLAAVLRPLWSDGEERVWTGGRTVYVEREGAEWTRPVVGDAAHVGGGRVD